MPYETKLKTANMKAEITESGMLILKPENTTEDYALGKWFDSHKAGCSFIMDLREDIAFESYIEPKIKLPSFPLGRIIAEGALFTAGICPNCHSTVFRKPWLFGKKYCINPECEYYAKPILK